MTVRRFDAGTLRKPKRLANGFLRVDGLLTRTGIFVYRNPNGTERRELRLDSEVFTAEAMSTFELLPVTNEHPPEMLTADNAAKYAVGAVGEIIRRDGEYVRASLLVNDAGTIAAMENGKRQLSCGYTCDLDFTPGEYRGQRYDAVQRNIRGNHVALVEVGRAGPQACVRMDTEDAVMLSFIETKESPVIKIRIDGVEYEVSEQVAQAIEKERAQAKAETSALQAKFDDAKEKLEAAEAARKDAADPVKLDARVNARASLFANARRFLGADAKLDGMTDQAIKLAVIAKAKPNLKLDGKDASYIDSRFDTVLEDEPTALDAAHQVVNNAAVRTDAGAKPSAEDEKRKEMIARQAAAWKKKDEGSK